jgi:hypothetical protein
VLVLFRVGCGVVAVCSLLLGRTGGRVGVEASPGGIGIVTWRRFGMRGRHLAWSDIKAFRVAHPAISPPVCAELWSGELVKTALVQGRKMRWRGGASRDLVAVLNTELARARTT